MKAPITATLSACALALALGATTHAHAQVSADILKSISIPDKVDTTIGTLEFFDGAPIGNTVKTVYDNLDRTRALGVYLDNSGAVSIYSVLAGLAEQGANAPNKIALFDRLMDSQTLVVTANTSTLYAYSGTDLAKDGPTVIEVPPGLLGFLDDAWQRYVGDIGLTGPDKGKGIEKNADGSYDLYFAPQAPKGKEGNWLQTVPRKSWFMILRMYGPTQPWINKILAAERDRVGSVSTRKRIVSVTPREST